LAILLSNFSIIKYESGLLSIVTASISVNIKSLMSSTFWNFETILELYSFGRSIHVLLSLCSTDDGQLIGICRECYNMREKVKVKKKKCDDDDIL
jgi:hypothetical protein